jgi:holo-[acyl-carrier protein] synthase
VHDARLGVDLVDVQRLAARFDGREDALAEIFTAAELTYCRSQRRPWPHLAARLAAKEAVFKALRTGLSGAMRWRDIEVVRDPAGAPQLVVTGTIADVLREHRVGVASVSLSHTANHAIAVVLLAPGP